MLSSKLPKGLRKFIRSEKARIRRSALSTEEKVAHIHEVIAKYQRGK